MFHVVVVAVVVVIVDVDDEERDGGEEDAQRNVVYASLPYPYCTHAMRCTMHVLSALRSPRHCIQINHNTRNVNSVLS